MEPEPSAGPRRRAPRAEARENRARLLRAARQVFAARGPEARVEEIATAAGLGLGTFYRNFPSKQALVDELVGDVRRRLLALATRARRAPDGRGLEQLLVAAGRAQARDPGYMQFLWTRSTARQQAVDDFLASLSELLADAQRAGRIRADVVVTDVWMTLWSLRGILEMTRTSAPGAWRRHLEVSIAGLRTHPAADEPFAAAPLSLARARRAIAGASAPG
jgi:AcrR family transcriptional regulator